MATEKYEPFDIITTSDKISGIESYLESPENPAKKRRTKNDKIKGSAAKKTSISSESEDSESAVAKADDSAIVMIKYSETPDKIDYLKSPSLELNKPVPIIKASTFGILDIFRQLNEQNKQNLSFLFKVAFAKVCSQKLIDLKIYCDQKSKTKDYFGMSELLIKDLISKTKEFFSENLFFELSPFYKTDNLNILIYTEVNNVVDFLSDIIESKSDSSVEVTLFSEREDVEYIDFLDLSNSALIYKGNAIYCIGENNFDHTIEL